MAEVDFERRLERLFADPLELPDAGAFADRVARRLDRGWTARRWLIGAAGGVGGVIGASQLMMANVFQRVTTAEDSARLLSSSLTHMAPRTAWMSAITSGGGVVWIAVAMAALMMGFVLTRVIGEILTAVALSPKRRLASARRMPSAALMSPPAVVGWRRARRLSKRCGAGRRTIGSPPLCGAPQISPESPIGRSV